MASLQDLRESSALRWAWVVAKQIARPWSERWFVARARTQHERRTRIGLLRAFARIHRRIWCAHQEREPLLMADWLLVHTPDVLPGVMVECGCFRGGSTAKLSLVAEQTGRQLVVCDSFEGLPEPSHVDRAHANTRGGTVEYVAGDYSARGIDTVRGAVARFGAPGVCTFVPGYFEQTLGRLKIQPAFVFMDVDYTVSARACLAHLWPPLIPGGRFYTHEAGVLDYVLGISDSAWWRESLNDPPPVLMGAGYGMGDAAQQLAYFEKPATAQQTSPARLA